MKSLKELYRIGKGPSSSHTMAPFRAAVLFKQKYPGAVSLRVTLFGSLGATGKGHDTDRAIEEGTGGTPVVFIWKPDSELSLGQSGMLFEAMDASGGTVGTYETCSTGGGALIEERTDGPDVYQMSTMAATLEHCRKSGESYWEYVEKMEGPAIGEHLGHVWDAMCSSIEHGLGSSGVLPGGLGVQRKAGQFLRKAQSLSTELCHQCMLVAYAYAVAEENASGGIIVTAPTCGASGVLPAVLRYHESVLKCSRTEILHSLATAGIFGNIVKNNGSISGAVVGCQGEVGVACAMAAAAAAQLLGGSVAQIEYASEMGLEHHLGLTCDPVCGLVQIPCIERNVHAAARAITCAQIALLSDGLHRISFDDVVSVLLETGRDMLHHYRETGTGGLARMYQKRIVTS